MRYRMKEAYVPADHLRTSTDKRILVVGRFD